MHSALQFLTAPGNSRPQSQAPLVHAYSFIPHTDPKEKRILIASLYRCMPIWRTSVKRDRERQIISSDRGPPHPHHPNLDIQASNKVCLQHIEQGRESLVRWKATSKYRQFQ